MADLHIGIAGNIGAGKSTLAKKMSTSPLDKILLQVLNENNVAEKQVIALDEGFDEDILKKYYSDPKRYALMAQLNFFNGRLARQRDIANQKGIVIEDRTLQEDYHVFGKAQAIMGVMGEEEFQTYEKTFRLMTQNVKMPDVLIYLKADVETLEKRIQKRGRDSEEKIPTEYLNLLNNLYETYINEKVNCPIITIDANKEAENEQYFSDLINSISQKISSFQNIKSLQPGLGDWISLDQTKAALNAIKIENKLRDYLAENQKLITVSGNIGLGKSTLAGILSSSLRIGALYENPLENPLLEKFLGDKPKYCHDLQLHFLEMRSKQRMVAKNSGQSYIKDRSLPEDLLIFCDLFHRQGYLSDGELDSLEIAFKSKNNSLPQTDLLICLEGESDLAWSRIQQRDRKMEVEGGWPRSDINGLHNLYQSLPHKIKDYGFHDGPILRVNVGYGGIDVTNRIHTGYLLEQIYNIFTKDNA